MTKRTKWLYVVGMIIIFLLMGIAIALICSGIKDPIDITIRSDSASKVYDGTPLTAKDIRIVSGKLEEGHTIDSYSYASLTESGIIDNLITDLVIRDKSGKDVTKNYNITYEYGTLEVRLPEGDDPGGEGPGGEDPGGEGPGGEGPGGGPGGGGPGGGPGGGGQGGEFNPDGPFVIIRSASDSKIYDGTPLTAGEISIVGGKLEEGHSIASYTYPSLTELGEIKNTITDLVIQDEEGNNVTDEYYIFYEYGMLEVYLFEIAIRTDWARKVYDGEPLTAEGILMVGGALEEGHSIVSCTYKSLTEVGMTLNSITDLVIQDESGKDVTVEYRILCEYGMLEVAPRDIKISSGSGSKVYDGKPLTVETFSGVIGELAKEQYIDSISFFALTDVGKADNVITELVIKDRLGNDVTGNYRIEYDYGTLEVTDCKVTIETGSATKTYDGTSLRCEEYTIEGLPDGFRVYIVFSGEQKGRGRSENTIGSVTIYDQKGDVVTRNFVIIIQNGVLTVI